MSFRPPPGDRNGYGPGFNPSNGYNPQQQQYNSRPSQYQASTNDAQDQYWNQNGQSHSQSQSVYGMNGYSNNGYYSQAPLPVQQYQQPQFISPSQLQQAPVQPRPAQQYQQTSSFSNGHSSTSPAFGSPSVMAPKNSATFEVDTPLLLVSLAEEYFSAAQELAPSVAFSMTEANVDAYEGLIATGLGCLDTALKNVKLAPRVEAKIRLRYAGVLFEETENSMEAETTLSKGIALCERNHYFDLKYAMQFLLAQFMAKKNPKASMKSLDSHVSEAHTYQQFSWVYAFRFLRASHSLQSGNRIDTNAAVLNLRLIANLAGQQQDYTIHLAASLMEAMAYMNSTGPDAMQNVQEALAKAWSNQLNVGDRSPQLIGMAHVLQVACSIRQGNPSDMINKLAEMQKMMDEALRDPTWGTSNDAIAIPINRTPKSSHVSQDTRMILGIGDDGRDNLMMSFLSKKDAYAITYLLCGMVLLHKNSQDHKAFKYLEEGVEQLKEETQRPKSSSTHLPDLLVKNQWRGEVLCYFRIYMAFSVAAIGDWVSTNRYIEDLKTTANAYEVSLRGPLGCLMHYLTGVYHQGIGDFEKALEIYKNKKFDHSQTTTTNRSATDQVQRDIALLASLNTLCILQDSDRKDISINSTIINELEPLCSSHPNKEIQTAFNLIVATVKTKPETPLFKIKNYLRAALNGAQQTCNTQFTCITLNVMCNRFFTGVVGPQAEKSAQAAAAQAGKSGNPLWRSVAEGMLGHCYEVQGKTADAQEKLHLARMLSQKALPDL